MAKWLLAECEKCGQFWALETLQRKIEYCSRCNRLLSEPPKNLVYSKEYLEEEEYDLSDEFIDFEYYCRKKVTSPGKDIPGEFRRPTQSEISACGDYVVSEVEFYHQQIKRIAGYYHRPDLKTMAWMKYWDKECEESKRRLHRLRNHFGDVFKELELSVYRDDLIRRSMTDLWTSEWFANDKKSEPVEKCRYRLKSISNKSVAEEIAVENEIIKEECFQQNSCNQKNILKKVNSYKESWSTEELAKNTLGCVSEMKSHHKYFKKKVKEYRLKAPPPVNAQTKFVWRKGGNLMHLTLVHPLKDGTDAIEIVGTNPTAIRDAKNRIEAARWLAQWEEDFNNHMGRENRMLAHLDGIADILDELNYRDRYLEDFID